MKDLSSRSFALLLMSTKTSSLFLGVALLCVVVLIFLYTYSIGSSPLPNLENGGVATLRNSINVYIFPLPESFNYGLLKSYWSLKSDSRIGSEVDNEARKRLSPRDFERPLPYPENPVIKQYSAEYWLMGDLLAHEELRVESFAKRVFDSREADVIFVPFFATLSAELQLVTNKAVFRKKAAENEDYMRQKKMIDLVKNSEAWQRSGGRDHVYVLTDPVAMWHIKDEIATGILLVVDFGGWYRLESSSREPSNGSESMTMIRHTQVSLIKDVIIPYTHLLPRLTLPQNRPRHKLLYFRGAKHRHRGGMVREKLWDVLANESDVTMESGFPDALGREASIKGMRTSDFCLHPAGDTPSSCRLFDAIQSLCIPVIVSDDVELPFEGTAAVDYSMFSVFVAVGDAVMPGWLVSRLRDYSTDERDAMRRNMAEVQAVFEYGDGEAGTARGDGAVNNIWRKVHEKLPVIREAVARDRRRRAAGVTVPARCHCT